MTTTTLLSDVVLPTATWYEKHDISSTDMHPFLHAFSPAIDPPWEARTDHDTFKALSYEFTRQAKKHLGTRKDIVSVPLLHDTPRSDQATRRSCTRLEEHSRHVRCSR